MRTSTEQDYKKRILRVLIHIQQHLDDAVSLEELAEIANFSPFHFHRVFRGMIGESVMEHIRRLRIERAALELINLDEPVTQIAFHAGYETLDAFTKAFRESFGVPPSAYRKEKSPLLPERSPNGITYRPQGDLRDFEPISTGALQMDVQIKELPAIRVAFVHEIGPYAKSAERAWQKLCSWAGPRGIFGPTTRFVGVSYDSPDVTPSEKIRFDACLSLSHDLQPEGEIGVQDVGNGLFAAVIHKGPYNTVEQTYNRISGEWLPKNGYRFREGPSIEFYLNDPNTTKPEDLLTEINIPVEKGD